MMTAVLREETGETYLLVILNQILQSLVHLRFTNHHVLVAGGRVNHIMATARFRSENNTACHWQQVDIHFIKKNLF